MGNEVPPRMKASCWKKLRPSCIALWVALASIPTLIIIVIIIVAVAFPSYTHPPAHYQALQARVAHSTTPGRANIGNEKIFIATALYDVEEDLTLGAWGQAVLDLIGILGPENVFLSLYGSNPSPLARTALKEFSELVKCNATIISEDLSNWNAPRVTSSPGKQHLERVEHEAEIRNHALRPLDDPQSVAFDVNFDKLLYINNVIFNPVDAANLLFSTNQDEKTGKTRYRAACAADFINPFNFHDSMATRDAKGNPMGIPFFPWFSRSGRAASRKDVLDQRDAVRVRSCWGGMVALEGKWFQPNGMDQTIAVATLVVDHSEMSTSTVTYVSTASTTMTATSEDTTSQTTKTSTPRRDLRGHGHIPAFITSPNRSVGTVNPHLPLRFRRMSKMCLVASECCLLMSDLQALSPHDDFDAELDDSGIYMNPYVRVAYSTRTFRWLHYTKRLERLYIPFQVLLYGSTDMPYLDPKQTDKAGEEVMPRVWVCDDEDERKDSG